MAAFTVFQQNMNRCGTAHDVLHQTIQEQNIDLLIGQEPNLKRVNRYLHDRNNNCFIEINRKHALIDTHIGTNFVTAELEFFVAISCYFSPNGDITDFETLLEDIERVIRGSAKEIILGGDLNAKTTLLGSLITNRRGQILEDWLAKNSFVVINNGRTPTFSNANGSSYIDITATTPKISSRTRNWTVDVEYENFSDHRLIHFEIFFPPTTIFQTISNQRISGWKLTESGMK